jgi:hypothetical protein
MCTTSLSYLQNSGFLIIGEGVYMGPGKSQLFLEKCVTWLRGNGDRNALRSVVDLPPNQFVREPL